jgi:hypothetical protein
MWGSMPLMTVSMTVILVLHCRGCTRSPWVMIMVGKLNSHCTDDHPYTLPRCVLGNHYKVVQLFHLACNVPTEVSPPVWASHRQRSPPLCLMGSSRLSCTHTIPWFSHRSFTKHPSSFAIVASPHNWLVRQDETLPHTMLGHTHIGSWLYYFHRWLLHKLVLRFGYDN